MIYGWDPGILVTCYSSHTYWLLGDLHKDQLEVEKALSRAEQLGSPFHRATANALAAMYRAYRGEFNETLCYAETAKRISEEYGILHWLSLAVLLKGWALAKTGQAKVGSSMLREGIDRWKATGAGMGLSTFLALHGDALRMAGQIAAGLQRIEEGLRISALHGEVYYDAELHRIKGELLLKHKTKSCAEVDRAETSFLNAVKISRKQGTKSLELRATLNLARLWKQTGKSKEAHKALSKICNRFSHGLDTPDLKTAKALLSQVSGFKPL